MAEGGKADAPLVYRYTFTLDGGQKKEFTVRLDRRTLQLLLDAGAPKPEWTKLSHRKCSNCPLEEARSPHCPAAVGMVPVMEAFGSATSHDEVQVRVESEQRDYEKRVPLQKGLSGLIGLIMASSGCPVVGKLRPLVRYHQPFSNLAETQYRIVSMYLLAQFLISKKGKTPDWTLKNLGEIYQAIQKVNQDFMKRLLTTTKGDAGPNALVILNAFADAVTFTVDGRMVEELEQLIYPALE